jgi:hypothetical protein
MLLMYFNNESDVLDLINLAFITFINSSLKLRFLLHFSLLRAVCLRELQT